MCYRTRGGRSRLHSSHPITAAVAALVVVLALAGSSCSEPRVLEASARACADHVDNDGDGRTDCADADCATSGACEVTLEACRDGLDEDRDVLVDCADEDCVSAGHCAPFATDCAIGARNACPEGMVCTPSDADPEGRGCALPGTTGDWLACTSHGDCGAGRACVDGICEWICLVARDCPTGSLCVKRPGGYAACAPPCVPGAPSDPCSAGGACRSLDELGYIYDPRLPLSACVLTPRPRGVAREGEACEAASDPSRRCVGGLVCHPEGAGGRCRTICAVALRDRAATIGGCPEARECVLQDMDVTSPAPGLDAALTGLCLPGGPP